MALFLEATVESSLAPTVTMIEQGGKTLGSSLGSWSREYKLRGHIEIRYALTVFSSCESQCSQVLLEVTLHRVREEKCSLQG